MVDQNRPEPQLPHPHPTHPIPLSTTWHLVRCVPLGCCESWCCVCGPPPAASQSKDLPHPPPLCQTGQSHGYSLCGNPHCGCSGDDSAVKKRQWNTNGCLLNIYLKQDHNREGIFIFWQKKSLKRLFLKTLASMCISVSKYKQKS